ncbi:unnamed protein product, partial [Rotaria sp. Silwood1]
MPSLCTRNDIHCISCEANMRRGEYMDKFDSEKDWCKYAVKEGLVSLCIHNSCRLRIMRKMKTSDQSQFETHDNTKCDAAVQTDEEYLQDSKISTSITKPYHQENASSTKLPIHQLPTTDSFASHSNTIQLPLRRLSTSRHRCCVCNIYFSKSKSPCSLIKQSTRFNMLLTHNVFIPNGTMCCRKHLHDDEFKSDAIIFMKKGPNTCAISDHELMELLNNIQTSFNELQSLLTKARSRPPIDFDDDQMTTDQYLNLTGISKENFFDLCSHIPSTSLKQTSLRSARQSIGCLLVKLRLGLSNQTLASLFSLLDRRTASRVIDSARNAIIKHFVPKYLGFSHLTRRELIDNHTRPLAKLLFDQPGEDKAIIILDGTYIYVQKSGNNLLQRRTYSLHKGRALIKPM